MANAIVMVTPPAFGPLRTAVTVSVEPGVTDGSCGEAVRVGPAAVAVAVGVGITVAGMGVAVGAGTVVAVGRGLVAVAVGDGRMVAVGVGDGWWIARWRRRARWASADDCRWNSRIRSVETLAGAAPSYSR